jgi:hypothetical protein
VTRTPEPHDPVIVVPAFVPLPPQAEAEGAATQTLPRDHPQWVRDTVSISSRARTLLANLKPLAARALTFWDHAVRSLTLRAGTLRVDVSGSYRLE